MLAEKLGLHLVYLPNAENLGCAKAWNRGIKPALEHGVKLIGIVNNDVVFSQGWDAGILAFWKRKGAECAFSAHVFKWSLKDFSAGAKSFMKRNALRIRKQIVTAAFFVDASIFSKFGFFDERYFVGFEDYDFMTRLYKQKIGFYALGNSVVWHKEKSTRGSLPSVHEIHGQKLFLEKWGAMAMQHPVVGISSIKIRYWRLRERLGLL